jgi:serine/threonine protein kinase
MARLLIVEDEPRMATGLRDNFWYEGYEVIAAQNVAEGIQALDVSPDIVLLDVLSKTGALDFCIRIRAKWPSIPLIMLTVLDEEAGAVLGVDLVTKPFSMRELSARVRKLLSANCAQNLCTLSPDHVTKHARFLQQCRTIRSTDVACRSQQSELCPTVGGMLGHYRILSRIGSGGMGVVYMAYDELLGRKVAVKVLAMETLAGKSARAQLLEEARNAASLNHPNVCAIYDLEEAEGGVYMIMELVAGQTLKRLISQKGLPSEELVRYGIQIAEALAHAHAHGVIHRDLKSSNVVVNSYGCAKVLDFGLSTRLRPRLVYATTRSLGILQDAAALVGTIHYLAPEILRGETASCLSDLWSFGVLLYESAVGELPFQGETAFAVSAAILHQVPAPLPCRVPTGLRAVIERCLSKSASQRYQQFSEVSTALQAVRISNREAQAEGDC